MVNVGLKVGAICWRSRLVGGGGLAGIAVMLRRVLESKSERT